MFKNVLITSAGRRGMLVQLFQRELKRQFPSATVFATDIKPEISSACQLADRSFKISPIASEGYMDELLEICIQNKIGLVIPTIDTELRKLADSRDRFLEHSIHLAVSSADVIRHCRDKRLTKQLFSRHNINSPKLFDPVRESPYPLFAKPYDGSSSNNLFLVESFEKLSEEILSNRKLIFTEYLSPLEHDEYTVDMYFDRHSELKCFVPRLRIETRAGEISKGRTSKKTFFQKLKNHFKHLPGARGCLTVQFFARRKDGHLYGIEINPRFGGGFPLSYEAGANFPGWLIAEYLRDEPIDYFEWWEDGLTMLRYDQHVLVRSAS